MIRKTMLIAFVVALGAATPPAAPLALASPTQIQKEPAKDLFLHFLRVPGIEVRFVDYHWQPALFDAMERGDATVPEARRNWVIARVTLDERPLRIRGKLMGVGTYALAWWPNLDGKGMAIEIRRVDMRDVFPDVNALAPAPRGETAYKGPAAFEKVSPLAPQFDATLGEEGGTVTLTILYGDRRLLVPFVR
jgi:hypothetical protein